MVTQMRLRNPTAGTRAQDADKWERLLEAAGGVFTVCLMLDRSYASIIVCLLSSIAILLSCFGRPWSCYLFSLSIKSDRCPHPHISTSLGLASQVDLVPSAAEDAVLPAGARKLQVEDEEVEDKGERLA